MEHVPAFFVAAREQLMSSSSLQPCASFCILIEACLSRKSSQWKRICVFRIFPVLPCSMKTAIKLDQLSLPSAVAFTSHHRAQSRFSSEKSLLLGISSLISAIYERFRFSTYAGFRCRGHPHVHTRNGASLSFLSTWTPCGLHCLLRRDLYPFLWYSCLPQCAVVSLNRIWLKSCVKGDLNKHDAFARSVQLESSSCYSNCSALEALLGAE